MITSATPLPTSPLSVRTQLEVRCSQIGYDPARLKEQLANMQLNGASLVKLYEICSSSIVSLLRFVMAYEYGVLPRRAIWKIIETEDAEAAHEALQEVSEIVENRHKAANGKPATAGV